MIIGGNILCWIFGVFNSDSNETINVFYNDQKSAINE